MRQSTEIYQEARTAINAKRKRGDVKKIHAYYFERNKRPINRCVLNSFLSGSRDNHRDAELIIETCIAFYAEQKQKTRTLNQQAAQI